MATPQEMAMRFIFPQASNRPQQQQQQQPWWASGNYLSNRGSTPVGSGGGGRRRRNVFYDATTGAPTSQVGNTIGGQNNDLEIIREIMRPRSSIVVNDPSGWLNGKASEDFQKFFSRTPEQEANYARRKRELDAGSVANINPEITRNAVDVARKNQEAMDMIFPKAPASQSRLSSDITQTNLPGGMVQRSLDGRYGTGSATTRPAQMGSLVAMPQLDMPTPMQQPSFDMGPFTPVGGMTPETTPQTMTSAPRTSVTPSNSILEQMGPPTPVQQLQLENEIYKQRRANRAPLAFVGDLMSFFFDKNAGQKQTAPVPVPASAPSPDPNVVSLPQDSMSFASDVFGPTQGFDMPAMPQLPDVGSRITGIDPVTGEIANKAANFWESLSMPNMPYQRDKVVDPNNPSAYITQPNWWDNVRSSVKGAFVTPQNRQYTFP